MNELDCTKHAQNDTIWKRPSKKTIFTIQFGGASHMYVISGYLNNSQLPFKDISKPLIVSSCGNYRLRTKEKLLTWRPRGRLDYQLLYVAAGKARFFFNGKEQEVTAGHMVLFQPKQEQHYDYYAKDKPNVYWVHFTGGDVKNILKHYTIPMNESAFYCGNSSTYAYLFKEMINELQNCQISYQEQLEMYLRQVFLLIQRSREVEKPAISTYIQEEMNFARHYFNEHYNEVINIEKFAQSRGMSVSWFLRNFKQITKQSPMQYILNIRMNNAISLLETTNYNVAEISTIIGYDNPLYFSRIFKKHRGISPSDYRKRLETR